MKVFLADAGTRFKSAYKESNKNIFEDTYILQSFFYVDDFTTKKILPNCKMFLLDSGAFTFMNSKNKKCNFEEYIVRYIDFIKFYDIKYFFELDVDSVVGYEKVKEYRERLEKETGKKCIPVWHKSRGKDEFLKMCDKYDYVAIGGIVTKEITKEQYPFFTWFINEAHKRNCKIHGLGFTSLSEIEKYHFDSVDSTSWTSGNRFGIVYNFDGKKLIQTKRPNNKRIGDHYGLSLHNFNEWLKFQKYADKNL